MKNIIRIHKQAGSKKNAVRISKVDDIPEFLKDTVAISDGKVSLVCVEGNETCPLGSVIGYEESENTGTGYNTWYIANAATNLIEKDGVFYTKATILEATPMDDEFPELLRGAKIWRNDDGSWSYEASWGVQTGFPGKAYWVKSGVTEEGVPKGYILTKTEESYMSFIVCNENGEDIGFLYEIGPA